MSLKKQSIALFILCCFFLLNIVECEKKDAEQAHNRPSTLILSVSMIITCIDDLPIEMPVITEAPEPTEMPVLIPVSQLPNATGVPHNIPFPVEYN
ncbi:hypothetical protein GpartN1_g3669.t1 [Galdieria partita]|uniref:Uncharacterized protein n=1 Tax=Galdieria partita TaxID=83374 RepID=A0A9C7PW21_9RHOD|nr:hypothetical protein GpartN1_g3669.t1 [Galdieria partita]